MLWLKRSYLDIQNILQQVNNGIISPQSAASQLRGMDVCGIIANMIDNLGRLSQLSNLLMCGETSEPVVEQSPEQNSGQNPEQTDKGNVL